MNAALARTAERAKARTRLPDTSAPYSGPLAFIREAAGRAAYQAYQANQANQANQAIFARR